MNAYAHGFLQWLRFEGLREPTYKLNSAPGGDIIPVVRGLSLQSRFMRALTGGQEDKMPKFLLTLLAMLALPVMLFSQEANTNRFAGTWKLNVEKSKFSPGPGPKSETVVIAESGETKVQDVGSDGKEFTWSFTPSGNAAVPIQGMDGATVAEKRVNDHINEHTWNRPDFKGMGRAVLAKNGQTVTYTMNGNDAAGKPVHNLMVYEREQ